MIEAARGLPDLLAAARKRPGMTSRYADVAGCATGPA